MAWSGNWYGRWLGNWEGVPVNGRSWLGLWGGRYFGLWFGALEVPVLGPPITPEPPLVGALLLSDARLATVYVHSPYWPRHEMACLTTAHNIDRSFVTLRNGDTGQGACHISTNDPALANPDVLQHGNLLVICSADQPPWAGVILTFSEQDQAGVIEIMALSLEGLIDGRLTPQNEVYEESVGGNAVLESVVSGANARNHTGVLLPSVIEIAPPVEDLQVGGQSVMEAINEYCGRSGFEWWLDIQRSPRWLTATLKLGYRQGFDISGRVHYYQGAHFSGSYKSDLSRVKQVTTAVGDFGVELPERNSVTRFAGGVQHLGIQAAASETVGEAAIRRLAQLPAGLRNEKITFEIMTGSTPELTRRALTQHERPLEAGEMFDLNFNRSADWRDLRVGNYFTWHGTIQGRAASRVVRIVGCQPNEEDGLCAVTCEVPYG